MIPAVRRPSPIALALVALASGAPACGLKQEPTGARAERYPLTTVDALGERVVLERRPRLIATTDAAARETLRVLAPDARVRSLAPGNPAALERAGADLLVLPESAEETPRDAAVFRYGTARFDDIPATVASLGLAVGRGPEGVRLARDLTAQLEAVRRRASGLRPVRVYIDAGALTTIGASRPLARAVVLAGGRTISRTARPVSIAELRRFNPEAWLVMPASGTTLRQLRSRPDLRRLAAVRRSRVHRVDEAAFTATPALPRNLERLVRLLHPAS